MHWQDDPLLIDLYELTMADAYLADGMTQTAVFEFFVRKLPARRGFLIAAGLDQAMDYLTSLRFDDDALVWLSKSGRFSPRLVDYLRDFRFTGDVDAMPEGSVFFPNEPILRVTAPMPEAQLVETRLMNLLNFETLIASKAARMVLAAPGKELVDFGARRAHGAEAALLAARASYIAGFSGTATVLAEPQFGIPIFGTMAHSFIEAHADESAAFERFALARPEGLVLLIDTYDTERAAKKVVALAEKLARRGIKVNGVRIDSGDLAAHARSVRVILDAGGLGDVTIFASGGLDEDDLARFTRAAAPIDGYGIGTSLDVSSDAPALDCAYKLQEYAGIPRRKRSEGKATYPGRKQVWRARDGKGTFSKDVLSLIDERRAGEALLKPVVRAGGRCAPKPSLDEIRAHARDQLAHLPEALRKLEPFAYPVEVSNALQELAAECDRRMGFS
ncbi:MAG TPA: nicotinate phosphoribosyltransferase [Methylovirgula sp.]|nr:nicotinate phosphoribosyltransferase [Methylovirgula sp.]